MRDGSRRNSFSDHLSYSSSTYSSNQSDPLRNSNDRDMPREYTRRKKTKKYLRESCHHRIKCTIVTFLVTFMWRRPLNSATLATTTHREPKRVSNGTGTQVEARMINKCRMKMVQRRIYNVKDPSWREDWKKRDKTLQQSKLSLYPSMINLYKRDLLELKGY